jgi:hypothetical protein
VKVNGRGVREPTELNDGDRIRIGTQELVFCRVETTASSGSKTTGFLRHCAKCRMPYPQEAGACPSCGASETLDDTLSGTFSADVQATWNLQLLCEVLERAVSRGLTADATRVLERSSAQLDERLTRGEAVDSAHLARLAQAAVAASVSLGDVRWAVWVAKVYARLPVLVPEPIIEKLGDAARAFPQELSLPMQALIDQTRSLAAVAGSAPALAMLERIRASCNTVAARG